MLSFKEISSEKEKATCLEIRRVVFIEGQGVPLERERRDEDKACRHFMAIDEEKALGTLRVICEGDSAKVQRMAVLAEAQGKGVGAKMLAFVLDELTKEDSLKRAILGSQEHAIAFYQKAGFQIIGEPFIDAGITHYLMEKPLR